MKKLLIALTTLTIGTTSGSLTSILNSEHSKILNLTKTDITPNTTQQDTIYIDSNDQSQTTSDRDLSNLNTTEIIQIGFYQNSQGQIQTVTMPKTVEKVPDTLPPQITSLKNMFNDAEAFNQDISNWNTSQVTDMSGMFYGATTFNQDISTWDTSQVTNMSRMFYDALAFNQDISTWDVSNVKSMRSMFEYTKSFNQDLSRWNVSNVTNMSSMFEYTEAFNQDLSRWNVSNVTNMTFMFSDAKVFNGNISNWNVSNVTNMLFMFFNERVFNQNLSSWNVSNVTNMKDMFNSASAFNQDISTWDTSQVTDMSGMFYGATTFNQDLSSWNVSNVTSWKDFSRGSGITDFNKLPKFKSFNNDILFEKDYRFLAHDWLKVKISHAVFEEFKLNYHHMADKKFYDYVVLTINNFPRLDHTGAGGSILQEDINTAAKVIQKHWDEISEYATKLPYTQGIEIVTNNIGSWDKTDYMGVFAQ